MITLLLLVRAPHICMVLFFTHIPFVVNHTFNATLPERLQQNYPMRFMRPLKSVHQNQAEAKEWTEAFSAPILFFILKKARDKDACYVNRVFELQKPLIG